MKIYYNPKLEQFARDLRNKSTLSEVLLWDQLKARKMRGYQFMRQKPIDNFIVDFFCSKLKLIIEIDGESHNDRGEEDQMRQQKLEMLGLTVMRFDDRDVKNNLNGVLMALENWIDDFESKT